MKTPAAGHDVMDSSREREAARGAGLAGALAAFAEAVGRAPFRGAQAAATRIARVATRTAEQSTLLRERADAHNEEKLQAETQTSYPEKALKNRAASKPPKKDPQTGKEPGPTVVWNGKRKLPRETPKTSKAWREREVLRRFNAKAVAQRKEIERFRPTETSNQKLIGDRKVRQSNFGAQPPEDFDADKPREASEAARALGNMMGAAQPQPAAKDEDAADQPRKPPGPAVWVPANAPATSGEPIGTKPGAIVRIAVTGSRDITQAMRARIGPTIENVIERANGPVQLLLSDGKGTDHEAKKWAIANKDKVKFFPFEADWENDGRPAAYLRNDAMLLDGLPNLVLSFPAHEDSRETRQMTMTAVANGIPVEVAGHLGGTYRLGPVSSETYEPPAMMDELDNQRYAAQILDEWSSEHASLSDGVVPAEDAAREAAVDETEVRAKQKALFDLPGAIVLEENVDRTGLASDQTASDDRNRSPSRAD